MKSNADACGIGKSSSGASLAGTSGCPLSCTAVPSSLLAVELGFRDCSSASAGTAMDSGASGVGGARLEGWPPLFPDASVRGEEENIDSDTNFGTNATDEPKLTNATDGPNDKVLFVGKYKVLSKVPRKRLAGAAGCRGMLHVRVGRSLA